MINFSDLPENVQDELREALRRNERQLGVIFRLLEGGVTSNRDLVERGGVANDGAAANLRASVRAIVDGYLPTGPSVSLQAGRTVGGLLRDNPSLSADAKVFLAELRERLDAAGRNDVAVQTEDAQILALSGELEQSIENQPGVYVYTLPTYYRTPKMTDPDRFLYKIGKTDRFVGDRIRAQQRLTGLPEDPWTLRVYRCEGLTPAAMERVFHELLEAAGHSRATGQYAGREWFATNLEFLDAIARAQEFEIDRANIPEE